MTADAPLAELVGVSKRYSAGGLFTRGGPVVHAVSDVDLAVAPASTLGIVGESGCGKSTLGRLLVGLESPSDGEVRVRGENLSALRGRERRARRHDVQMMFQDSAAAFNPRMSVARIIEEPLRAKGGMSASDRRAAVTRLVDDVGLATNQLGRFPRELSGGQRQRVGLARALATNPALVVADEPVAALDVSVRSQILNLLAEVQAEHRLSLLIVSHDLTVIHFVADHVAVMYLGRIVESGGPEQLFRAPAHHYTRALIDAVPEPTPRPVGSQSAAIRGELPSASAPPSGCAFRTRCPAAQDVCARERPPLRAFGDGHLAACHLPLVAPVPTTAGEAAP